MGDFKWRLGRGKFVSLRCECLLSFVFIVVSLAVCQSGSQAGSQSVAGFAMLDRVAGDE